MCLTGVCDYPYQTNIHKFTALLNFCPHVCYLTPLVIAWHQTWRFLELWDTKMLLDFLKIPCSWYSILNSEILQCLANTWNVNQLKRKFQVVSGPYVACCLKRAHCVCDVIIACINRGRFPALAAIFLLALNCAMQLWTC